jgi:putative acetyltransferase
MITKASKADYEKLITIWENSVRATHTFVTEEDIQYFKPLILNEYFDAVELFCNRDDNQKINGFIGVVEDKVEMLFVDACVRGRGIGKKLLTYAIRNLNVKKVDVNEQNPQAVGFYKYMGFQVVSRSPVDSLGKNYPLLLMELECKPGDGSLTNHW